MSQLVPQFPNYLGREESYYPTMYADYNTNKKILDGLNCGVPTRTTATLTPTTLRNIEQTFIELQCQAEPHQNQAGFVPPLIQPLAQGNGLVMSLVDTKSWQGGSTVIGEPQVHPETLRNITPSATNINTSPPTTTRRNMGGRRPNKDKSISPEEEERRQVRRERNKLAAARCRKRRLDHTNELLEETEGLEEKKQNLQKEIHQLKSQKEELEFLLEAHKACCRLNDTDVKDVKPFLNGTDKVLPGMPVQIKREPSISPSESSKNGGHETVGTRPRPNSLPVATAFTPRKLPSEVSGVPITTPTSGIPFNFESLMDGGTGLTPVSGPLIPSCSSQQRNSSCVDLSSPDSVPTKLVSL